MNDPTFLLVDHTGLLEEIFGQPGAKNCNTVRTCETKQLKRELWFCAWTDI
jgi:hypothetical protein